jgi:glyoxalase family protein
MGGITGIHHITCIAGDAQQNFDFYTNVLGMRLVKKSVNQDAPDTYHLFYADGEAHPGADLTFFPWGHAPRGRKGIGLASEIALAIPAGSLELWTDRLAHYGVTAKPAEVRRGDRTLPLVDPDGLEVALVETSDAREFVPWDKSPVPADRQILGLHAVRLWERDLSITEGFLTGILGFKPMGEVDGWHRFGLGDGGSGKHLEIRELPDTERGQWGVGTMHHVAWRVPDDSTELAVRAEVAAAHRRPTEVIDRFWFKSVYFLEPGGVLFEIATDGPGFTADEELATLGERLVLPPWLEPHRREIERALPPLENRHVSSAR